MKYGDRIAGERKRLALTQEQLADQMEIKRTRLSNWEKSRREPEYQYLIKMSNIFGCTIDYLLGKSPYRRGRLVTDEELETFLPTKFVRENKVKILIDELELTLETRKEIEDILRKDGYLK